MSSWQEMRRGFSALLARIDALTLRERALLFATVLVVCAGLWHVSLMKPLDLRIEANREEVESLRSRIDAANQGLQGQALQLTGAGADSRTGLIAVEQRLAEIDGRLGDYRAELIDPAEMARLLEGVLKDQAELRLIRIRNLDAEQLAPAGGTGGSLYRHGLEIEVEGSYLAVLKYLEEIEALPWRFYWQLLELDVQEYPRNRIRIEVSTMSLDEEWIGA